MLLREKWLAGAILGALGFLTLFSFLQKGKESFEVVPQVSEELQEKEPRQQGEVIVHVAGKVVRPGVYKLAAGSRVYEALSQAGGVLPEGNPEALNLAQPVKDGEKIFVPGWEEAQPGALLPGAGTDSSPFPPQASGSVNINTASVEELDALPGVGPATAQKIVEHRNAHGPYSQPEDLLAVPGIGPKKLEKLKPYITF